MSVWTDIINRITGTKELIASFNSQVLGNLNYLKGVGGNTIELEGPLVVPSISLSGGELLQPLTLYDTKAGDAPEDPSVILTRAGWWSLRAYASGHLTGSATSTANGTFEHRHLTLSGTGLEPQVTVRSPSGQTNHWALAAEALYESTTGLETVSMTFASTSLGFDGTGSTSTSQGEIYATWIGPSEA